MQLIDVEQQFFPSFISTNWNHTSNILRYFIVRLIVYIYRYFAVRLIVILYFRYTTVLRSDKYSIFTFHKEAAIYHCFVPVKSIPGEIMSILISMQITYKKMKGIFVFILMRMLWIMGLTFVTTFLKVKFFTKYFFKHSFDTFIYIYAYFLSL